MACFLGARLVLIALQQTSPVLSLCNAPSTPPSDQNLHVTTDCLFSAAQVHKTAVVLALGQGVGPVMLALIASPLCSGSSAESISHRGG